LATQRRSLADFRQEADDTRSSKDDAEYHGEDKVRKGVRSEPDNQSEHRERDEEAGQKDCRAKGELLHLKLFRTPPDGFHEGLLLALVVLSGFQGVLLIAFDNPPPPATPSR
jgi:hypothetical protein